MVICCFTLTEHQEKSNLWQRYIIQQHESSFRYIVLSITKSIVAFVIEFWLSFSL